MTNVPTMSVGLAFGHGEALDIIVGVVGVIAITPSAAAPDPTR